MRRSCGGSVDTALQRGRCLLSIDLSPSGLLAQESVLSGADQIAETLFKKFRDSGLDVRVT